MRAEVSSAREFLVYQPLPLVSQLSLEFQGFLS